MGNIEKLVVLIVLFLCVFVLAFNLAESDTPGAATDPLGAARELVENGSQAPARAGLLSAEVARVDSEAVPEVQPTIDLEPSTPPATEAAEATRRVRADGKAIILISEAGLSASGMQDYMIYRVTTGDTWLGMSQRFYGKNFVTQMKSANEGLDKLVAGERILVPIVDLTVGAGERAPYEPTPRTNVAETGGESTLKIPTLYVVVDGDNLSRISEKLFGTQRHWRAIFEANRNLMDSADDLGLGYELVIPVIAE